MSRFRVEKLPDVDQQCIKRGRCPWCLQPLTEANGNDVCHECEDIFEGKITIED